MNMKKTFVWLMFIFLVSCGDGGGKKIADKTGGTKLNILYSKSSIEGSPYSRIKEYRVTVSGEGISEPIVATFDGNEAGGTIENIPTGGGRTVEVKAINIDGKIIRAGENFNVEVAGGATTLVEIRLDSVPIFTNLEDGNVVSASRLKFHLFADPEDPLEVIVGHDENILADASSDSTEIFPDILTGEATLSPINVALGEREFKVRSKKTGRFSSVKIRVVTALADRGAPLYSGASSRGARFGSYPKIPLVIVKK